MREASNGSFFRRVAQRRKIIVGWRSFALTTNENRIVVFQKDDKIFKDIFSVFWLDGPTSHFRWGQGVIMRWVGEITLFGRLAPPKTFFGSGFQIQLVQEWPVSHRRSAHALQKDSAGSWFTNKVLTILATLAQGCTRRGVSVFPGTFPQERLCQSSIG